MQNGFFCKMVCSFSLILLLPQLSNFLGIVDAQEIEFCTELVHLKKKEDKISLLCKLLTKMRRDAAVGFPKKPVTGTAYFCGSNVADCNNSNLCQMPPTATAAFKLMSFAVNINSGISIIHPKSNRSRNAPVEDHKEENVVVLPLISLPNNLVFLRNGRYVQDHNSTHRTQHQRSSTQASVPHTLLLVRTHDSPPWF